ncbi:MAG: hypothetical protein JXB88_26705 [Spirochaetales bacterium]|nr:hypothetical protein [Spirochaetales bacterium]
MGEIKSAIQIALEKTMGIVVDKKSIQEEEYIKKGKMIISTFLDEPDNSLDGCFKGLEKEQIEWVREGMCQTLMANLFLPNDQIALSKLKRVQAGFLKIIANNKKLKLLFDQLEGFFSEYIGEKGRILEHIENQYAPRLRQKEEALSKQLGAPVHLDINSDPEYKKILNQNLSQFDLRYKAVLEQVKGELQSMFKE